MSRRSLGPVCDGLYHEQLFHLRQSHTHAAHVMHRVSGHRLRFERQSAEDHIDVDARFGVTKSHHASGVRKLESILDAGENAMVLRGAEQPRSLVLWNHGKCVDIAGCAGPTEDRRRDATDHRRDASRLEPVREVGTSGDKEPRNLLCHGNARRMRRQRSRTSVTSASRSAPA